MGITIGLTYDLKEERPLRPGEPPDANAELDSKATVHDLQKIFESAGHEVKLIGNAHQLLSRINKLGVDVVFNIAEGFSGRNRESQVPLLLEMHNIPFIGSDALTLGLTLDKSTAKKCFMADGIPTPKFFEARSVDHVEKLNVIGFPLMVKPCYEGTSKGISSLSRVEDNAGLRRQVKLVTENYHQPALVEEFIKGKEFTVVVFGNDTPEPMPVIQYVMNNKFDLGNEIYTFERVKEESVKYVCPAQISDHFAKKLQAIAVAAYKSVYCKDFGRVDFRVDDKENIYVLEVNPLPNLSKRDTFLYVAQALGKPFEELILRALDEGLSRLNLKQQTQFSSVLNSGEIGTPRFPLRRNQGESRQEVEV
ncbi:MAG: ATP-grasp domain-containing protein [Candidatus Omnitrophica bacterium]|nr:ATP-grasp domain-containing protein [Candidatus Omnitrophota bacterium]